MISLSPGMWSEIGSVLYVGLEELGTDVYTLDHTKEVSSGERATRLNDFKQIRRKTKKFLSRRCVRGVLCLGDAARGHYPFIEQLTEPLAISCEHSLPSKPLIHHTGNLSVNLADVAGQLSHWHLRSCSDTRKRCCCKGTSYLGATRRSISVNQS